MSKSTIRITKSVNADAERVWAAMTEPDLVRQWMMGATVTSDWQTGSPVTWEGEYNGQSFQDKGEILEVDHARRLVHTHFSPMSGAADVPENYHRVEWTLQPGEDSTELVLEMPVDSDEQAAEFEKNWSMMLDGLTSTAEA